MMDAAIAPGRWRNPGAYDAVLSGGRSALAWELLRRDIAYRAAMSAAVSAAAPASPVVAAADPAFTARWGLHFRRKSGARLRAGATDLVGVGRSRRAGRQRRARFDP